MVRRLALRLALPSAMALGLVPAAARAEPATAAGLQASTLGLGVELQLGLSDRLALRGGANALSLSGGRNIDGVRYDTDADLKSTGALVDYYPGLGGLRLSAGLRLNGNEVDLAATPTEPVSIGGTSYTPGQVGRLSGSVEFLRLAPYLGIGWQESLMDGKLLIGLDLGAMYQGRPDVGLTASGALASPSLAADLAREAEQVEDEYSGFRFYPVISLTVSYRF